MAYTAQPSRSQFGHPQVHLNDAGAEEYNGGEPLCLKLPISFALADAAVLYTVPANIPKLRLLSFLWEPTTSFSGGSSSAIGLSSSNTTYTTKGMLHGGSAGDVAAALTAGYHAGTVGTGISADPKAIILVAGNTIRFDRITSVFTAGAGYVHAHGYVFA